MTVSEHTLRVVFTAEDRVGGTIDGVRGKLEGLAREGERSGGLLSRALESLGRVAEVALGVSLAGAVDRARAAVEESVRAYAEFERASVRLAAASRGVGQDVGRLAEVYRAVASAAAREFAVTALDAVGAMEALIKAGLGAGEAMAALGATIALARIEGADFASAGSNLVQVLAQFGLRGEEAARVADALVNASRLGIGAASDFAQGLANVAATAKALGLGLEDTTAWLVVLERRMGSAVEAGTHLNRFLLDLAEMAEKLGVPLRGVDGGLRSVNEVVMDLIRAVRESGTGFAELQERLKGVDVRSLKTLLTLSQMTESFEELRGEVGRAGSAMEMLAAQMDTVSGRLERQRAEIDRWQRSVGEAASGLYTMIAPTPLRAADAALTSWRGVVAYFTGDEFQKLSAAVETQLRVLGRISEEEAAEWIMSWVEMGRITRSEALEIAGSLLSLSTIARTELGRLVQQALATGEEVPNSLKPLADAMDSVAFSATKARSTFEEMVLGMKASAEDLKTLESAISVFSRFYDVTLRIEEALGHEVELTEEAKASKERLAAATGLLSYALEAFSLVQQAVQLYMLGGREAGDLLVNTMERLVAATEDGTVSADEFRGILEAMGINTSNAAQSLHGILLNALNAVKAAIEGNTEAAQRFADSLTRLDGTTIHTFHYHHIITVTDSGAPRQPSPQEIERIIGRPLEPLQRGAWFTEEGPAYLHRGEMVLPRSVAEWFRRGGVFRPLEVNVRIDVKASGGVEAEAIASAVSRELLRSLRTMGA